MKTSYPKSWKDVTLKQYVDILKLTGIEYDKPRDKEVEYISILSGLSKDEIYNLDVKEFSKLQNNFSFIERNPVTDNKDYFIIDGVKYKTESKLNKIKTGEFLDLNELTKEPDKIYENLSLLLAIFYRPTIKTKKLFRKEKEVREDFKLETVFNRKDLFEEKLTAEDVWNSVDFFLSLKMKYLNLMNLSFSKRLTMKKIQKNL